MKKRSVLALAVLGTATLASGPISAQTFQNGPYYANPSWDQQIPAAQRFIVLSNWNNAAVLDRETGLVWQRAPSFGKDFWSDAFSLCIINDIAGRFGWRLPGIQELASLTDLTQTSPALPAGHPFQGIGVNDIFWSATTFGSDPTKAWTWGFARNGVAEGVGKASNTPVIMVRPGRL